MSRAMVKFKSKMVEIDAVRVMVADYNGQTWDGPPFQKCRDGSARPLKLEWSFPSLLAAPIMPSGKFARWKARCSPAQVIGSFAIPRANYTRASHLCSNGSMSPCRDAHRPNGLRLSNVRTAHIS